ncbi:MAG: hypothetical protein R6X12_01900 [bacterium]
MRPRHALLFLAVLAACDRPVTPTLDPGYREPIINGYLYRVEYYDWSVDYLRDVEVFDNSGFRMVPSVRINSEELPAYSHTLTRHRYGDEKVFRVYRPYNLSVVHYWGEAFSRVTMPGSFEVTAPRADYIHGLDSTLAVTWKSSAGAQWYWLDLYCDFEFVDSLGDWDDFTLEFDTFVRDTFVVLPPRRVFPREVAELVEGDGSALVVAGYGPEIGPGDIGNVRGAGFGFFTAGNEPRERYFYVGAPPRARRAATPDYRRGRLLARVRRQAAVDTASAPR